MYLAIVYMLMVVLLGYEFVKAPIAVEDEEGFHEKV